EPDRRQWHHIVAECCTHKYTDPAETDEVQTERIARFLSQDGLRGEAPRMRIDHVYAARSRLRPGGATGGDEVAVEMLFELSAVSVEKVSQMFEARYVGGVGLTVTSWTEVLMTFLAKETRSTMMRQHRGVSLLSCMLKGYTNVLLAIAEEPRTGEKFREVAAFGFVADKCCSQIVGPIRNILSKACEWPDRHPAVILSGDVLMAFDFLAPREVAHTLQDHEFNGRLSAGLREGRGLELRPLFRFLEEAPEIRLFMVISPTATVDNWDFVLDMPLPADTVLAPVPDEVQNVRPVPLGALPEMPVPSLWGTVRVPLRQQIDLLGICLTATGFSEAAVEHRISRALKERFVSDAMDMAREAGWRRLSVLGRVMQLHGKWVAATGRDRWRHRAGWKRTATWADTFISWKGTSWRELRGAGWSQHVEEYVAHALDFF
ncbi:unnamed protein product, partial [Prorocentrum cordatum]